MIQKDSVELRGYIKQVTVISVTGDMILKRKTHIYRKYSHLLTGKFTRKIASL